MFCFFFCNVFTQVFAFYSVYVTYHVLKEHVACLIYQAVLTRCFVKLVTFWSHYLHSILPQLCELSLLIVMKIARSSNCSCKCTPFGPLSVGCAFQNLLFSSSNIYLRLVVSPKSRFFLFVFQEEMRRAAAAAASAAKALK